MQLIFASGLTCSLNPISANENPFEGLDRNNAPMLPPSSKDIPDDVRVTVFAKMGNPRVYSLDDAIRYFEKSVGRQNIDKEYSFRIEGDSFPREDHLKMNRLEAIQVLKDWRDRLNLNYQPEMNENYAMYDFQP